MIAVIGSFRLRPQAIDQVRPMMVEVIAAAVSYACKKSAAKC